MEVGGLHVVTHAGKNFEQKVNGAEKQHLGPPPHS